MRHCENCGEELREGRKFYCGKPIPLEEPSEPENPERNAPEPAGAGETRQSPGPTAPDGPQLGKWKKIVLGMAIVIVTLAVVAAVAWQSGIGEEPAEPAIKEPAQAVDQDDLLGTLDWKEDQDKEYELKHSLIEGNPDSNVKEIFEESAYFTPKRHAYATDGDVAYYLIECEYDKGDKTVPYMLVFQVNEDKHLELVELHKNGKKVGEGKYEGFYERLYETADQAAAEKAATEGKARKRAKLPPDIYSEVQGQYFYDIELINSEHFEEEREYSYIYVKSIDADKVIVEEGSMEGAFEHTFHRVDDINDDAYSYSSTAEDEEDWSWSITLTKDNLANQTGHYKMIYTTSENGVPYRVAEYHTI